MEPVLTQVSKKLFDIALKNSYLRDSVSVVTGPLSPREAIGTPSRKDYPLLTGKEVIVEAEFRGSHGQAFTSEPQVYNGSLENVLRLPLSEAGNKAILLATLNAVASHLGIADRVRHCRNEEPENCAREIAQTLLNRFGYIKIGMIGFQPAILDNLVNVFGKENVNCTDLNPDNVGSVKFGIKIWNGALDTRNLINWADLILVTSSTLANNTFDAVYQETKMKGKELIIFGITGAAAAVMIGLERVCFYGH